MIIDRAAELLGKNRTEFMLEASLREAELLLLEQRTFRLDHTAFDAIAVLLGDPPPPLATLRELVAGSAPWE